MTYNTKTPDNAEFMRLCAAKGGERSSAIKTRKSKESLLKANVKRAEYWAAVKAGTIKRVHWRHMEKWKDHKKSLPTPRLPE